MDREEIIKRVFKYLILTIAIAMASRFIPACQLDTKEIIMIGIVGAITFGLLDMYAPSVSHHSQYSEQEEMSIGVKIR